MNKLLIYKDINNLDYKLLQDEYDFIITSYSETSKLLNGKINNISIGDLTKHLFTMWNDKEEDYANIVQMRNFLENDSSYFSKEILNSFSKSIKSTYKLIKMAKELQITPEEYGLINLTLEQKLFLKLMKKVYIQDSFIDFDLKLFEYDYDISKFTSKMDEYLKETLDIDHFYENCKGRILIQGFYYISPIQEIILTYLKKSGLEIIPILCYDERYIEINKIVDVTFNSLPKYELKDSSVNEIEEVYVSDVYASILDGKDIDVSNVIDSNSIAFRHYDDLNLYNKDLLKVLDESSKDKQPNIKAFAVNKKEVVDRISIFRGDLEDPERISIKYYPLGIFLKEIYNTWDDKLGVCLSIESLSKIFECNFLQYDGYQSIDYLEDLNLISSHFLNCRNINEWINQLNVLKNNISNLSFESQYKTLLSSYGPFTIKRRRLEIVEEYINKIKEITDIIFFDKKGNIDTKLIIHLKNLYDIIERNTDLDNKDEEDNLLEYKLLGQINELLNKKRYTEEQKRKTAKNRYLFEALSLYISTIKNNKQGTNDRVDIYSLDAVEAVEKNINEIHIYDFDRDMFPTVRFLESKYIKDDILEEINKKRDEGTLNHRLINRYLNIINNKDLVGRYVFWLALKTPNIKKNIYRLRELDKDNVHFYQKVLENKLQIRSEKNIDNNLNTSKKDIANLNNYKINNDTNRVLDEKSKYMYFYCPLRAYLLRINKDREVYIENFSIEHFIPNIVANINLKTKLNINGNRELINKNFNQYSKLTLSRLCNIAQSNINYNLNDDDIFWLPKRLKQYEDNKVMIRGIEYLYTYFVENNGDKKVKNQLIPIPNNGKSTCSYCSFKYICVEKNLHNNNYPNKYWTQKKENRELTIEKVKSMDDKIKSVNIMKNTTNP
ncbi:hypothetical protein [Romboutsia sp. 1001713B170131_170501_G6]|uniref:hypothetical protein n=1 Tax=Romboutsia sp. 1001713B170131_170501_G6 TaxID=2787108 RepID=UPI0018A9B2D2|nr:hypothetical protein [Romboutsia sp. 1001713B170131_170501_G6]